MDVLPVLFGLKLKFVEKIVTAFHIVLQRQSKL